MTSEKRALTVTYGSFSCTLEGFDDVFTTMKAITQYFREKSAETALDASNLDTASLKRIAERELNCDVDVKIGDKKVVLSPAVLVLGNAEPNTSTAPANGAMLLGGAQAPQVAPGQDPVKRLDGLRRTAAGTNISKKFVEKSAEVLADAAEKTSESSSDESVAEKLSRIRSAVAQNPSDQASDFSDLEDSSEPAAPAPKADKPKTKSEVLLLTPADNIGEDHNNLADSTPDEAPQSNTDGAAPKKPKASKKGRNVLNDSGKTSVTRLVNAANSQLEGSENLRRLSAIAHLKAAVAAKAADREAGSDESGEDAELNRYRDDLTQIVQDNEDAAAAPQPKTQKTEAPLVLASSEKVGNDSTQDEDVDGPAPIKAKIGFPEFAALSDADDLLGLLEVSAAYLTIHEGRAEFSRQLVMETLSQVVSSSEVSREDGIRAFGNLLKQGKIEKAQRGLFSLPAHSPYRSSN